MLLFPRQPLSTTNLPASQNHGILANRTQEKSKIVLPGNSPRKEVIQMSEKLAAFVLQFEERSQLRSDVDDGAYDEGLQMSTPGSFSVTHILTETGGTNDVDTDND